MKSAILIEMIEQNGQHLDVVMPDKKGANPGELLEYIRTNQPALERILLDKGAVLFRGFGIGSQEEFLQVKQVFSGDSAFGYVDGNSPRTKLSAQVYTSTEYPKDYRISLHNEMSYSNKWPRLIFFYCQTPAAEGGETPILDARLLLKELGESIVEPFEKYGVRYTRYLTASRGLGKGWKETFDTPDKGVVEEYCRENEVDYRWDGDNLCLSQTGAGVAIHPVTNERVWFNQANQFHPSSLPDTFSAMLSKIHGTNRDKYPHYAYYGNGGEIDADVLKSITEAQFDLSIKFPWQTGDVLMLDNMLMEHGRMPFKGDRKILVSMC
jgi:alpha-ketoglutarate-dependent taurine dioxygenase